MYVIVDSQTYTSLAFRKAKTSNQSRHHRFRNLVSTKVNMKLWETQHIGTHDLLNRLRYLFFPPMDYFLHKMKILYFHRLGSQEIDSMFLNEQ